MFLVRNEVIAVTVGQLITKFEQMCDEHWAYSWTGSEYGNVSCSGAFQYAVGKKLIKEKSSNWMARNAVEELLPISQAKPGMAAFKRIGQNADTPERWLDGKGDFYHVGLVSRTGKTVLNAQSTATGFVESKLDSSWTHCGRLKGVANDINVGSKEVTGMNDNATVNVETTLNVRKGASVAFAKIGELRAGERVEITDDLGEWCAINYEGGHGFVASRYLTKDTEPTLPEEGPTKYTTLINVDTGETVMLVGVYRVAED